mgnify:CR=1 FL=1
MSGLSFYQKLKAHKFSIFPLSPTVEKIWWYLALWAFICASLVILLCIELICLNFPHLTFFGTIFALMVVINVVLFNRWWKRNKK